MLKRLIWVIAGLFIALPIAVSLVGIKVLQFKAMGDAAAQMVMPPETVNVEPVRKQEVQSSVTAVGTVVAVQGIVVRNEMEGMVTSIHFEPGSMVKEGDELVRLDTSIEQSELELAQAGVEGAQRIFDRAKGIYAKKGISEADFSAADTNLKEAKARLSRIQATIAKKTIRAPFSGKLGIRRISIGEFLDKGSHVVSLQKMDPVFVEFSLPQQQLGGLSSGLKVVVSSDSYPGQTFEGTITAIEPDVDVATRNVTIQATLANEQGKLIPGMFVTVEIKLADPQAKLFIPATGVQYDPEGEFVYVVGDSGNGQLSLTRRKIGLGMVKGDFVEVTEGLVDGDRIVSTGVFKLREGMNVVIDEALAPPFSFDPRPDNT